MATLAGLGRHLWKWRCKCSRCVSARRLPACSNAGQLHYISLGKEKLTYRCVLRHTAHQLQRNNWKFRSQSWWVMNILLLDKDWPVIWCVLLSHHLSSTLEYLFLCLSGELHKSLSCVRHEWDCSLCEFPRAAVTKHHEPGGIKYQKLIVSQFWGWKSKIKVSEGPCSPSNL